jgi:Uma2 family endonuclease
MVDSFSEDALPPRVRARRSRTGERKSPMAAIPLKHEVHYPESDGRPMGETDQHITEILELISILRERYRNAADVYVGGDMLLYYVEGDPGRRVCPDVFVTFGIPKEPPRRSYFLWREGRPPSLIIEVTSKSSRREDLEKKELYARLGVEEYFLHDPLGEYLKPLLQGFRLEDGKYVPIPSAVDGSLMSRLTGLTLRREGEGLRLVNTQSGELLLKPSEAYAELVRLRRQLEQK